MKPFKKLKRGFTLIEMTIVLFIISLLILIVVPNLGSQRNNAKSIHGGAMESMVQTQIDSYLNEHADTNVSYDVLQSQGYLSAKQVKQAEENGIKIVDNNAKR